MKRVIVLHTQSGDWEGLFIDGNLIDEGHMLGNGNPHYMMEQAEKFNFTSADLKVLELNDVDDYTLNDYGSFPDELSKLSGKYNG